MLLTSILVETWGPVILVQNVYKILEELDALVARVILSLADDMLASNTVSCMHTNVLMNKVEVVVNLKVGGDFLGEAN